MAHYYTAEKNIQMLIYLMKQHGVKKVIASPGTTNITLIASLQQDPFFEMYSVADERSAAYMACGLAAESGEPVAISCTGATASRNYIPGLTEAYYRKLPVLAVTSTQHTGRIGQLVPQVLDRSVIQNDIAVMSVDVQSIYCADDEWSCNVKLNSALLALRYHGGGPVHVNLHTVYSKDFTVQKLPDFRVIRRISHNDQFPQIQASRVGIFVGAHQVWSRELTEEVDRFCEKYNAAVLCDHTSNYHGKYGVLFNLVTSQKFLRTDLNKMELLIDMGNVSGAYMKLMPKEVWRVNPDGTVRDQFRKLTNLFDMSEIDFFKTYTGGKEKRKGVSYFEQCEEQHKKITTMIPELPFSNLWVAKNTAARIPEKSVVHFAILNSLRSWNYFKLPSNIDCYSNTGGFGIDGFLSTLVGACLAHPDVLHFGVVGDLAFFYDMNGIANRNLNNNLRILLVNNGCGTEFKNYNHPGAVFGEDANAFIAAAGHYGKQSRELVKHYAQDLGFEYLSADNKSEFLKNVGRFVSNEMEAKPILFEVFTNSADESNALKMINQVIPEQLDTGDKAKRAIKGIIGDSGVKTLKKIVHR